MSAFYTRCDYVWSVSHGTANTLREYGYKGEITVIPNGCDMPITHKSEDIKKEIFNKYKFDKKVPLLLFVGRLTFIKNTDIIIEALGALSRQNKRFNMLFVGEGEDRKAMQEMVEKQGISSMVSFTGKVMDRELLMKIYVSSDLLLFPSVYDNAPLVIREAAACGCASVLIRGSNSAEGLIDGHNVFLSKETTEDFALTINTALVSNQIREVG
ncbi:MAG: glycosyltransferase [Clostridiales bacterium]|nr:glycosyltransferase [Clostridiales bacterium]